MQPQLRSAGRIALGAIALLLFAGVMISPSAAVVLPSGQFEENNSATNCAGLTTCSASFQPVPAFKTVTITNVSCQIVTTNPASIVDADLATLTNPKGAHFLPTPTATSATTKTYLANAAVLHFVTALDRPTITLTTSPGKL